MSSARESDDDINTRSAKALLMMADAIANGEEGEEKVDMIETLSKLNGVNPRDNWETFSTLIKDLRYFASTGVSTRWTASDGGFRDVLDGAYAMHCEPINGHVKERVRGKFKCTLCGQLEKNCNFVVHFTGCPPVERGQELPKYSASDFQVSDPEKLSTAYSQYAESYNSSSTVLCEEAEAEWPVSSYLGLVAPGETCLKHLFTAFSAKDLVRSTIDDAFERKASLSEPLNHVRVKKLASTIAHLREAASGRRAPPFQNTDGDFWLETMQRFADGIGLADGDEFGRLRAGYLRMEQNVKKTGYMHDDDDDDEEDSLPEPRERRTCKRVVDDSSDEEEGEEEDGVEDDDGDSFYVEDDEEEDYDEEEDECNGAGPSNSKKRWGSTVASRSGPFAKRRRVAEEPFSSRETRASRRRTEHDTPDDTETDPISIALRTVDKNTASKLRAPRIHVIGSRRSTIKKLGHVGTQLLEDGDLSVASATLNALAKLTATLDTHERGAGLSDHYKSSTIKEVHDGLRTVRGKLLTQGHADFAKDVAESIIVAHELLA